MHINRGLSVCLGTTLLSLAIIFVPAALAGDAHDAVPGAEPKDAASASPAASTAVEPAADPSGIVPGPLFEKRKQLREQIQQAGKRGAGISGYMNSFTAMEQLVREGKSQDDIAKHFELISRALESQKKSQAQYSSSDGSGSGGGSGTSSYEAGRALGQAIGRELRMKYGRIPSDAELDREFASPQFKNRIMQAFLKNIEESRGAKLTGPDLAKMQNHFWQTFNQQLPAMKQRLGVLRRAQGGQ